MPDTPQGGRQRHAEHDFVDNLQQQKGFHNGSQKRLVACRRLARSPHQMVSSKQLGLPDSVCGRGRSFVAPFREQICNNAFQYSEFALYAGDFSCDAQPSEEKHRHHQQYPEHVPEVGISLEGLD